MGNFFFRRSMRFVIRLSLDARAAGGDKRAMKISSKYIIALVAGLVGGGLLAFADPNAAQPEVKTYGAAIAEGAVTPLAEVLTKPDAFTDKRVIVEGVVRKACTRKGCWMEVAVADKDDALGCRVTFKDYGFFVPKDSAGAKVRVDGVVTIKTVEKSMVEHYESEGARFSKKLEDGSALEVRIVAAGVELSKS